MDGRSPEAAVRQNLLDRLLHAVKQVQVHFGARQEIATESDLRVSTLCVEWEAVLVHGQKKPKAKPTLLITSLSRGPEGSLGSLWPLAKLCLGHDELQRFLQLEHTTSDIGRGRAWLRASINERTLENYLHTILASGEITSTLYESNAFILDEERSSMLPVMAAGLSSIIFSIPVDAVYLNSTTRSVDVSVPVVTTPTSSAHPTAYHTPTPTIFDRMPDNIDDEDDVIAVNAKERKKKKKKQRPQRSDSPSPTPVQQIEPPQEVGVVKGEVDMLPICDSTSSSSSRLSINEEGNSPMYVALETGVMSQGLMSSETEAAVNATALVLSATTGQPVEEGYGGEEVGGQANQMSAQELREAVLVLVKAKDELEQNNSHLQQQVTSLESSRSQLLSDLEGSQSDNQSLRDSHTVQLQALERENDLLREQLKKYVGMLQAQRRESSANSTESLVPSLTESSQNGNGVEHKLAEMAEMYGELMELNERLHKSVANRDAVIATLVSSLRQAGIQIPVPTDSLPPSALQPKVLVDVWIPSVIKKGRGPEQHHVYQVFVRVRSEEWNVYRRYAEFREFHRQLQKYLPKVNSFSFPPKKTIGSKSTQFAEDRRQKLQDYLRLVIQLCTTTPASVIVGKGKSSPNKVKDSRPILQADITKATLVHLFPFFREDLYVDPQSKAPVRSPSYSGL